MGVGIQSHSGLIRSSTSCHHDQVPNTIAYLSLIFTFACFVYFILRFAYCLLCSSSQRQSENHLDMMASLEGISVAPPYSGELSSCSICLEELVGGQVHVLPWCGHAYHEKCINHWFAVGSMICLACKKRVL